MKKVLVMILALVMVIGMTVGCTTNDTPSESTTDQEETSSVSEETQSADVENEGAAETEYDFSGVPVQTYDPMFPNGAVFYNDLKEVLGAIQVPNKEIKIGFIMKSLDNEYWQMMADGIEEEAQRMVDAGCNVTVDVRAAQTEGDQEGQLAVLRDMINKKYDGIVAFPISDANLVPGLEDAMAADIPVVTGSVAYDENPHIPYYIGLSSYESGRLVAEEFSRLLGSEGGEVAIIMGIPNNPSARDRTAGFNAWIEENPDSNLVVVDTQNADWDRMKAKDIADIQIKKYPDLKAIFCNNDTMALGALESVKAADKLGDILIAGTDGTNEAIESIKDGELTCTAGQFSYYLGKMAIDLVFRAMDGVELPERVWGSIGIINASNASSDLGQVINWTPLEYEVVE